MIPLAQRRKCRRVGCSRAEERPDRIAGSEVDEGEHAQ